MYNLPQEIEVWYVIPAIRKELAKILIKEYKLKYDKISKILGVSKAAVSQYISGKRGIEVKFDKKIKEKIKKIAKELVIGNKNIIYGITEIIRFMKKNKSLCNVCKKYNKEIINICKMRPAK